MKKLHGQWIRASVFVGLVLLLAGCGSSTTPENVPKTASSNEESVMPEKSANSDQRAESEQPLTVHLALIGRNGQSLAASNEPVLGKKALNFYQEPKATRDLIAWLEGQGVQVREVREAVTSLTISADRLTLEKMFGAPLNAQSDERGRDFWTWGKSITLPPEMQGRVADAVLPLPTDFPPP